MTFIYQNFVFVSYFMLTCRVERKSPWVCYINSTVVMGDSCVPIGRCMFCIYSLLDFWIVRSRACIFFVLLPIGFELGMTTVYSGSGQVNGFNETLIIQGDSKSCTHFQKIITYYLRTIWT